MTKIPKLFKFQDSTIIEPSIASSLKRDASDIIRRERGTRLEVEIDATHSGVITNRRVYPSKFVSTGYLSFFSKEKGGSSDYDKPILKHHDIVNDAIGRIVGAKYTQLKFGDQFLYDYLYPDEMGSKGSGVVTVKGIITDPESINKIVDGRYLSVSAGHSSDTFICSVCADSLYTCEHIPGESYESEDSDEMKLCYGITGTMTYNEVSFVNLPAQPVAKLLNYNWKDESKDTWNTNALTSFSKGKKEMVRTFKLIDEDGELSLLNGEHRSSVKKTVVAVSPAIAEKLKHKVSSEDQKSNDEITDVRQDEVGTTSGVSDVEQDLDKAKNLDNTSNKEITMDAKQIEKLEADSQGLKDELTAAKAKIQELEKQVEAKDSQIQRLTTDATEMQTKMSKSLAFSLATLKVRLKKPGTEGIDSKDKLDSYVQTLSARSVDSLQDSLEDILMEMPKTPEAPVEPKGKTVAELAADSKVESPTLSKGAKPVATKTPKSTLKRGVDALSEDLGL
jgi:predicted  nucleic acid-binding Zn-ribbon protein